MAIDSTTMTRHEAREAFWSAGLTYDSVTRTSLQRLRSIVNRHMRDSGCIRRSLRCHQRGVIALDPDGKYAAIRCRACYFDDREAITFNPDGFIGFAGWADSTNVQPILQGFIEWVRELKEVPDGQG